MPDRRDAGAAEGLRIPWSRSERPIPRRVVRPLQAFVAAETSSGIVLILAACVALLWANGPWSQTYERAWSTLVTVGVGGWRISEPVRGWVDEGLMAVFFLVVSLEIKRELVTGELRHPRVAILPVVAAIGGMALPAVIYLAFNAGGEGARGWGAAMPTDIAFALGVVALAGRRVPVSLKTFILALAIVDDLGSIVVVALFYSGNLDWAAIGLSGLVCAGVIALQRIHVRSGAAYGLLGLTMWLLLHDSGVSPTLAGVALGLVTPAVAFQRPSAVSAEAHRVADQTTDDPEPPDVDAAQWLSLAELSREAVSPLVRLESALHPWTSLLVLPLFALANAGISLGGDAIAEAAASPVAVGMVVARLVGKTVGITVVTYVAVRFASARMPAGLTWRHILGGAAAAGIPFTVSIFIAGIALPSSLVDVATTAILAAAVLSGALAFAILRSPDRGRPVAV